MRFYSYAALTLAASSNLFAQTTVPPAPIAATPTVAPAPATTQTVVIGAAPMNKLTQGTEISLRLLRDLTTKGKMLKVGDRFDLETVDPIKLGSATVIPSGTRAVGEIMSVRNKGMWGKSGKFDARILHMRVGDRQIRMGGTFDDKGKAGGWGAGLTSAIIFAPAGFFMTGTSALVPAGTIVKGFLDEDVPVTVVDTPAPVAPLVAQPATQTASGPK